MNPIVHGETFVTNDKDECDQDIGNYERFLNVDLGSDNYMTTGRVYLSVIENERSMKYKGKCVEVVPHIPEEINRRIKKAQKIHKAEITIIEIGGTIGEYQNILFLEAARMLKLEQPKDVVFVLVSYLPVPSHIGEMKTKPTQYASRSLDGVGIHQNLIIARGPVALDEPRKEKLAIQCGLAKDRCISAPDVPSIYEVPLLLDAQGVGEKLEEDLYLKKRKTNLKEWKKLVKRIKEVRRPVKIAVVGKYFGTGNFTLADSYVSVIEAIKHACWANGVVPELTWINSEDFEKDHRKVKTLKKFNGMIVPGGFGSRGIDGILIAIRYAREKNMPYFGLCYGMQLACVEFSRNILKLKDANSVEINEKTKNPIIHVNPFQTKNIQEKKYGGTMRLGAYDCDLKKGSKVQKAYGKESVSERHRHRYEFNNAYRDQIEEHGLQVVGVNPESNLVEIVELKNHPFFVGVQFHPEFQSRPLQAHPLFVAFVKAANKRR